MGFLVSSDYCLCKYFTAIFTFFSVFLRGNLYCLKFFCSFNFIFDCMKVDYEL